MNLHELLVTLKTQEIALHQPELRHNAHFISQRLHDNFIEFGRSGSVYSKTQIINLLTHESFNDPVKIWSQDYRVHIQEEGLALLLYKSAHITNDHQLTHHTLRSSVWKFTDNGWQMIFHQGTPTSPFVAAELNESA